MLAHMNQRMGAVGLAQPEVERQVAVGRDQVRVVIHRALINLITARRLNADEGLVQAQAGDHQTAVAAHRVLMRRAPALEHRLTIGLGQALEHCVIVVQAQALMARAQVQAVQVVGDAAQQGVDQSGAAVRQGGRHRVPFGLQRAQDVQRCRRRIQAHAIADTAVAGWIIGQDQRHTLVRIRQPRQLDPAARQFGDKIHALGRGAVAHHVRLAALTAPCQVLEADRPADDAPVQLRQGNVHRQVAGAEPLCAGLPAGLVILGADRLDHRDIAPKRAQVRCFRAGLGKACGVEYHCGLHVVQQVLDHREATGLFQTGHCDGQRVQARGLQALAEHIDKPGIGRLQVRAVEQHRSHGEVGVPLRLPVIEAGIGGVRVIDRRTRQGLRFGPGIVAAQMGTGQAAIKVQRIAQATLAQKVPQTLALFGGDGAQAAEFRVRTIVPRHQDQRDAASGQFHQALDAVAPITDAAVQGNQDDLGVAQHLIDVQVDRGVVLHLHRVGQAQAGVILGQLLRRFGEQRQAGIAAAQDHQLGGGLAKVGDIVVRDEATGLGPEQVHG
ncbi:hypothetical protein [Pseudomonas sp. 34 E 7]|nr:hypothetical protein [Pseudomonas sp. 34 E 7]